MAGLFSCCGYDTAAEKDSTINVITNSPTNSIALQFTETQSSHSPLSLGSPSPANSSKFTGTCGPDSTASLSAAKQSHSPKSFDNGGGYVGSDGLLYSHRTNGSSVRGAEEDMDGCSSVITLTPEQKEREKMRLQALVKSFAKSAVASVSCRVLHLDSTTKEDAEYTIDKSLMVFTVSPEHASVKHFHMSNLQEVYSFEDLGNSANTEFLIREPAMAKLSRDEKTRLVMLEYTSNQDDGYLQRLFILEDSTDGSAEEIKDRFVTCMKILRLYAQTAIGTVEHP